MSFKILITIYIKYKHYNIQICDQRKYPIKSYVWNIHPHYVMDDFEKYKSNAEKEDIVMLPVHRTLGSKSHIHTET